MLYPRHVRSCLIALILLAGGGGAVAQTSDGSLADRVDRYCIRPDGDHRMTWQRAEEDGYVALAPGDVPDLRLISTFAPALRGFRRVEGDREFRILTSSGRIMSPDQGVSYFRWCWVSASEDDRGRVDRDLAALLGQRGFRVERVRMFAWLPRPDGGSEAVSRRVFLRSGWQMAREQGLRQVTTRQSGRGVFVGYGSPRDEATYRDFDWAGPEPLQSPDE
ncbi:MAG: hypothetical protein Q8S03_09590 [Brevundimonas sp.]|uniref:hypothetical protein n=1 Tax=Brevundimonas sp. TaxID=1871086 RepID=UPI002733DEFC|nr:hypothetical protein [Brevundimonas sp.]MDP3404932.1 hypothetical protein [Brevundimonas sp.]